MKREVYMYQLCQALTLRGRTDDCRRDETDCLLHCVCCCGAQGGFPSFPLVWFSCVTLLAATDPASLSERRSQVEVNWTGESDALFCAG